eukprot:gb/GFBE01002515.1/.p1 GENE.gb/GFBE01002515.1/~~gb/GFBE01002515.1/.p1  ORF type:complete len:243 (+),score=26.32 gb/GFBE01002515.1/:1-729(+)
MMASPVTPARPRSTLTSSRVEMLETPDVKHAAVRHQQQEQQEQQAEQQQNEVPSPRSPPRSPRATLMSISPLSGARSRPVLLASIGASPILDREGNERQERFLESLGGLLAAPSPRPRSLPLEASPTASPSPRASPTSHSQDDEDLERNPKSRRLEKSVEVPVAAPAKHVDEKRSSVLTKQQRAAEKDEFAMLVKQVTSRRHGYARPPSPALAPTRAPQSWAEPLGPRMGYREGPYWLDPVL